MANPNAYIATERAVYTYTKQQTRYIYTLVQKNLIPLLERESDFDVLEVAIDTIERTFNRRFPEAKMLEITDQMVDRLEKRVDQETDRQMLKAGIAIVAVSEASRLLRDRSKKKSSQELVKGLVGVNSNTFTNLKDESREAVKTGDYKEAITRMKKVPTSQRVDKSTPFQRANYEGKNVSLHETGNAASDLIAIKFEESDVRLYRWMSQTDSKVRTTHRQLHNNIYTVDGSTQRVGLRTYHGAIDIAYSTAPTFPRKPWNCRCTALPYKPLLQGKKRE